MFGKWLKSPVVIEMFPKFHFQVCLYSQLSMRTHGSLNLTSCYVNGNTVATALNAGATGSSCRREAAVLPRVWAQDHRHPGVHAIFHPPWSTHTHSRPGTRHASIIPWHVLRPLPRFKALSNDSEFSVTLHKALPQPPASDSLPHIESHILSFTLRMTEERKRRFRHFQLDEALSTSKWMNWINLELILMFMILLPRQIVFDSIFKREAC